MQLFDASTLGYVVVAFVPNLLIMLLAMARMHRDLRVMTAKVEIVQSDNRMLDEGLKALAHEVRMLREKSSFQEESRPRAAAGGG
jgi:hypothetical protein